MLASQEFILEFLVKAVTIRNIGARGSPLIVTFSKLAPITLQPIAVNLSNLLYNRGCRLTFAHSNLLSLDARFDLLNGNGDRSIRGSCKLDFFMVSTGSDYRNPVVYELQACLENEKGRKVGILYIDFQLYQSSAAKQVLKKPCMVKHRGTRMNKMQICGSNVSEPEETDVRRAPRRPA